MFYRSKLDQSFLSKIPPLFSLFSPLFFPFRCWCAEDLGKHILLCPRWFSTGRRTDTRNLPDVYFLSFASSVFLPEEVSRNLSFMQRGLFPPFDCGRVQNVSLETTFVCIPQTSARVAPGLAAFFVPILESCPARNALLVLLHPPLFSPPDRPKLARSLIPRSGRSIGLYAPQAKPTISVLPA